MTSKNNNDNDDDNDLNYQYHRQGYLTDVNTLCIKLNLCRIYHCSLFFFLLQNEY